MTPKLLTVFEKKSMEVAASSLKTNLCTSGLYLILTELHKVIAVDVSGWMIGPIVKKSKINGEQKGGYILLWRGVNSKNSRAKETEAAKSFHRGGASWDKITFLWTSFLLLYFHSHPCNEGQMKHLRNFSKYFNWTSIWEAYREKKPLCGKPTCLLKATKSRRIPTF